MRTKHFTTFRDKAHHCSPNPESFRFDHLPCFCSLYHILPDLSFYMAGLGPIVCSPIFVSVQGSGGRFSKLDEGVWLPLPGLVFFLGSVILSILQSYIFIYLASSPGRFRAVVMHSEVSFSWALVCTDS